MAKDDYFTIVYKILDYLYTCLKEGSDPDPETIGCETKWYSINPRYWKYIMKHLIDGGYIEGAEYRNFVTGLEIINLKKACITPDGIEYLLDNHMIKKVVEILKTAREIMG